MTSGDIMKIEYPTMMIDDVELEDVDNFILKGWYYCYKCGYLHITPMVIIDLLKNFPVSVANDDSIKVRIVVSSKELHENPSFLVLLRMEKRHSSSDDVNDYLTKEFKTRYPNIKAKKNTFPIKCSVSLTPYKILKNMVGDVKSLNFEYIPARYDVWIGFEQVAKVFIEEVG
jgi:hypothetical protein